MYQHCSNFITNSKQAIWPAFLGMSAAIIERNSPIIDYRHSDESNCVATIITRKKFTLLGIHFFNSLFAK